MADEVTREWVKGLSTAEHHLLNAGLLSADIRRVCRAYLALEERCRRLEGLIDDAESYLERFKIHEIGAPEDTPLPLDFKCQWAEERIVKLEKVAEAARAFHAVVVPDGGSDRELWSDLDAALRDLDEPTAREIPDPAEPSSRGPTP